MKDNLHDSIDEMEQCFLEHCDTSVRIKNSYEDQELYRIGFQQNCYLCQFCRMGKTPSVIQSYAFPEKIVIKT